MLRLSLITFILIPIILMNGCSSADLMDSKWASEPIPIDGTSAKWANKTFYNADKNIMLGVQNDSSYLYLVITTGDRNNQMQILGRGFSVWFDKDGGTNKTFGIKYPVGLMGSGFNLRRPDEDTADRIIGMFDKAQMNKEIEILGPGENDVQKMDLDDAKGIEIKLARSNDVMIYEMKIALRRNPDNIYAIGVNKANPGIGVGFETTEIDLSKMRQRRDDNGESNPGNNGPGNRRHGNFGRGTQRQMPEQFKYWIKVDLATKSGVKK